MAENAWYGGNPFVGGPGLTEIDLLHLSGPNSGGWSAFGNAAVVGAYGLLSSVTTTDNASAARQTNAGAALRQDTSAVSGNVARISSAFTTGIFGSLPVLRSRGGIVSVTDARYWFCTITNNITNLINNDDPAGANSMVGFRFSTGVPDTNIQFCTKDGATLNTVDTGVVGVAGDFDFEVILFADRAVGLIYNMDGRLLSSRVSIANLPVAAQVFFMNQSITTLAVAVKSIDQFGMSMILKGSS